MHLVEKIIEGCIRNDRKAQKMLYEKYASSMLGVCIRYCKNLQEAEDVLQEGFFKLFSNLSQYRGEGPFEGWMKRIFINTAITHYQRLRKKNLEEDISTVNEMEIDTINDFDSDFTMDELLEVINGLPQGYKMVFNMFAIEGYKHNEIARQLGIDENTSKSQFSRARKLIQKKLEELSCEKVKVKTEW